MKLAIIRVRGGIRVAQEIKDTLSMLRLYRQNYCVVRERTPALLGMIKKAKDYVTWGEIDDETYKVLVVRRGRPDPADKKQVKPYFRLNPPSKGFGRKGIKKSYKQGGALGYRGPEIKSLIERMI